VYIQNSKLKPSCLVAVLATYQHCSFLNRLIHKSNEYPNCNVNEVNEYYTSKTCTNCGYLKTDLGKAKVFNCNNCKLSIKKIKCKFDYEIESLVDSVVGVLAPFEFF